MNTTYGFNGPNATRRYMTEWSPQLGGWASPHSNPFYLNYEVQSCQCESGSAPVTARGRVCASACV
jgi:hypothetical protein